MRIPDGSIRMWQCHNDEWYLNGEWQNHIESPNRLQRTVARMWSDGLAYPTINAAIGLRPGIETN